MTDIAELKVRADDARRKHQESAQALRSAEADLHAAQCVEAGIAIGDIVIDKRSKRLHRVVSIGDFYDHGSNVWVTGNPERADGTFGTAVRNLYGSWERVQ